MGHNLNSSACGIAFHMDEARFTTDKTGELVEIRLADGSCDWAFVPRTMPPDWEFDGALWPLLSSATTSLGKLDGLGRTVASPWLQVRQLQRREALRSSSLEGTYATPEELLLFEQRVGGSEPPRERHDSEREVWNYVQSLIVGGKMMRDRPLSTVVIKAMHGQLLQGVRGENKRPGEFRPGQVFIGSDRRFVPPPAERVDALMYDLQTFINSDWGPDPLVRCLVAHYQFEAVHPFMDGNGRVGRAVLALHVQQALGHRYPWLYMSAYFERYRDEYVDLMFRVSTEGRWSAWIEFCLRGVALQAEDAVSRCERLLALRDEFLDKVDTHRPRLRDLVERLFENPFVTIPQHQRTCGITYPTAKSDIELLIDAGVLTELQKDVRPKTFCAIPIFSVIFSEPDS